MIYGGLFMSLIQLAEVEAAMDPIDHTLLNCAQAPSIYQIGKMVAEVREEQIKAREDLSKATSRMEQRDDKLLTVLASVADQGARLDSQRETQEHQGRDIENMFSRIRGIEEAIGKDGSTIDLKIQTTVDRKLDKIIRFVEIVTSWPAMIVAGALAVLTISGSLFDLWYHLKGVALLWDLAKQAHQVIK
jgi:hypothetical protein